MRTTPPHEHDSVNKDDTSETNINSTKKIRRQIPPASEQEMPYPDQPVPRRASRYLDDPDGESPTPGRQGPRTPLSRRTRPNVPASIERDGTTPPLRQRTVHIPSQEDNSHTSAHLRSTYPNPKSSLRAPSDSQTPTRMTRRRREQLQDIFRTDDILEEQPPAAENQQRPAPTQSRSGHTGPYVPIEDEILAEDERFDEIEEDRNAGIELAPLPTTTGRQRAVNPPTRQTGKIPTQTTHARLRRPQPLTPTRPGSTRVRPRPLSAEPYGRRRRRDTTVWQRLLHNKTFLTVSGIVLILLLVGTLILANLATPTTSTKTSQSAATAQSQSTQPAVTKLTNPHELIVVPPTGNTHPAPPVLATSAYLLDATNGTTLYAYNPFMHIPMMSTTKLMTALLTVEHVKNLDEPVKINDQIANDLNAQLSPDSSLMGVKKNETYTVRDLLYGLFLVSGNDAAIVLADHVSGNLPAFVNLMNQRSKQLGLVDTHYENPHGLLATNHYSSAHDLAFLADAAFNNKTIVQISAAKTYDIAANKQHAAHDMQNEDQFLYWYPGVNAGKTGWDAASNFVQVISCVRGNRHLIGVVMHTDDWWTDMRNLMDYGFNNYTWISPRELTLDGQTVPFAYEWSYFRIDTRDRTLPMGSNGRFYNFTGYAVSGPILTFFDKNKGLQKFGYPESQPQASGTDTLIQKFQKGSISCNLKTQQCKIA